jgi:hypothetical protein
MKKELPMPVVIGAIVLVLGGVFAILWSKTSNAQGAGDVAKMAAEIKSTRTDLPVDPPDVARGDAMFRGEKIKKGGSAKK